MAVTYASALGAVAMKIFLLIAAILFLPRLAAAEKVYICRKCQVLTIQERTPS